MPTVSTSVPRSLRHVHYQQGVARLCAIAALTLAACGSPQDAADRQLMNAVTAGDSAAAAQAIASGANLSKKYQTPDGGGLTPLHLAVASNAPSTIRLLLASGASIHARTDDGITPLDVAVRVADPKLVALIAAAGLPTPQADVLSPMDRAMVTYPNQAALVEVLLKAGWDPNALGAMGMRQLDRAVVGEDTATIRVLLAAGANPDLPSIPGDTITPRKLATQQRRGDIAALFANVPPR